MMEELVLYRDKELRITLPSYLKLKKGNSYFFDIDRRRTKKFAIELMAIELNYNEQRAREHMTILSRTPPFLEWNGVTMKTIRMGDVFLKGNGFEMLHESFRSDTSVSIYRYDRIFCLVEGVHYAHAIFSLSGSVDQVGSIDDFHRLCCQIVESAEMI